MKVSKKQESLEVSEQGVESIIWLRIVNYQLGCYTKSRLCGFGWAGMKARR